MSKRELDGGGGGADRGQEEGLLTICMCLAQSNLLKWERLGAGKFDSLNRDSNLSRQEQRMMFSPKASWNK